MLLSKENLALARVVSTEKKRPSLTGVYVDPKRGVTAASDGAILVEVTAPQPNGRAFPKGSMKLADEKVEPFIVPAKVVQEVAKEAKYGAAVTLQGGRKPVLLAACDEKKAVPIAFQPISEKFPDYRHDGIMGKGDSIALSFRTDNLAKLLGVAGLGEIVKLTLFTDRIRVESTNAHGQSARGVLMCSGKPAAERIPAEPAKEAPEAPAPAKGTPGRRFWGFRRRKSAESRPPTPGQIAFYAYLLNRRGEKLTPKILEEKNVSQRIEDLKKGLPVDPGKCTWYQWKKLYLLLLEKADPKTLCAVLNSLTDIASTSSTIDAWLKRDNALPAEAAA